MGHHFQKYIGQNHIQVLLKLLIEQAKAHSTTLKHILLHGPSGYGKTTLAQLIAQELQVKLTTINGNLLQKPADIISVLTNLKPRQIVFIDEIHGVNHKVFEMLYPVLVKQTINILLGKGYHAKMVHLKTVPFTLIGATTLLYQLPKPFITRFSYVLELVHYNVAQIKLIVHNTLITLNIPHPSHIVTIITNRSRLNPRLAKNLVQTYQLFLGKSEQQSRLLSFPLFLDQIGIYQYGINPLELKYLQIIAQSPQKRLGLATITQILHYPEKVVTSHIEPYLLETGLISKMPYGRKLTVLGEKYLASHYNKRMNS